MRVEALDFQMGGKFQSLDLTYTYSLGQNGEVYIMGSNGRSYVVSSLEEAERLMGTATTAPQSPVMNMNGLIDLNEVTKLLNVGRNKIKILQLLNRSDLINILHLLPKEMLVNGLRLFNKVKLMRMLLILPKQYLVKMLLRIFQMDELIKKMPTNELMRILHSQRLNNQQLTKGLMQMEPQFVQLLLQRIYGDYNYGNLKPWELKKIFMHTPKERLMEGLKTLPFKALTPFVTKFVKEDPALLMNMSESFIAKLFDRMSKSTLLDGCMVLPEDMLIKMLTQLPTPLLVVAASQIDDKTLEKYLVSQQPNLLKMLAGAA